MNSARTFAKQRDRNDFSALSAHAADSAFGSIVSSLGQSTAASIRESFGDGQSVGQAVGGKTLPLPLLGGVLDCEPVFIDPKVIRQLKSFRHACRLAWKLRRIRNMKKTTLADLVDGLYAPHCSDYFSVNEKRRELPAKFIGRVERVLGNHVMSQWQAWDAEVTLLEEIQMLNTTRPKRANKEAA